MEKGIKCCKCGKEISKGHYFTPIGIYCTTCWEKENPEKKQEALNKALEARSRLTKSDCAKMKRLETDALAKRLETGINKGLERSIKCVELCRKIASMEKGCAPSAGHMQELITEAENALKM